MRFRRGGLSVFDSRNHGFAALRAAKDTPIVIRLVWLDAGKLRHGSAAWAFRRVNDLFGLPASLLRHDSSSLENCAPQVIYRKAGVSIVNHRVDAGS